MDDQAIQECSSVWVLKTELNRCVNAQSIYFFLQLAALIVMVTQPLNGFFVLAALSLVTVACVMTINYRKMDALCNRLSEVMK